MSAAALSRHKNSEVLLISKPTEQDQEACLAVLSKGFGTDPLTVLLLGEEEEAHRQFYRAKLNAALIDCEVWACRVEGVITCVALVTQPGRDMADSEEKRAILDGGRKDVEPEQRAWIENVFTPIRANVDKVVPGGSKGSYYISHLATLPEYRGRGLASTILQKLKEEAKKAGTVLSLESISEQSARLYQKHGLHIVYEDKLELGKQGISLPYYIMVHDPTNGGSAL
ncbi:hypothetical protein IAU60_004739 [Kwoniella sp. DSM 27419]